MLINTIGDKHNKKIIMLPGSFCNSKSMVGIYNDLKDDYYIILPEYTGHYENSTFTTRSQEASYIMEYLKENNILTIDMIYGQSMGAEIGIELLYQLTNNGIRINSAFFDGAPCIKLSYLYKKIMYLKFKTLVKMLKGKSMDDLMNWKFLKKFANGDPESLKPMLEPILEIAPIISNETIYNENECCYTFDFPELDDNIQKNMYFFYAKEEKAYKTCINGVKRAYPNANYEIVEGYGHLTYSTRNKDEYVKKLKKIIK